MDDLQANSDKEEGEQKSFDANASGPFSVADIDSDDMDPETLEEAMSQQ